MTVDDPTPDAEIGEIATDVVLLLVALGAATIAGLGWLLPINQYAHEDPSIVDCDRLIDVLFFPPAVVTIVSLVALAVRSRRGVNGLRAAGLALSAVAFVLLATAAPEWLREQQRSSACQ